MNIKPNQFDILTKLLNASEMRHQVISENLANVNTPGYHRLDVTFEENLARLLQRSSEPDVSGLKPEVSEVQGLPERVDGNNVDMDKEIGYLSKNAMLHETFSQVLASKLSMMRSAITGR